jgi:hypothetical protein
VFQKQETQFDNDFQISENANDTNTPKSDQQETPTSAGYSLSFSDLNIKERSPWSVSTTAGSQLLKPMSFLNRTISPGETSGSGFDFLS